MSIRRSALQSLPILFLTATTVLAEGAYRIEPGDTLEFAAASVPDLKTRATVNIDGLINLPLTGEVKAQGLTVAELSDKVRSEMSSKVFRRRTSDGREQSAMVLPEEISLTIADYRPIYVNGDVSQPGQQAFRPGLTVRQAIALAGGFDVMRFRAQNPLLEEADFRADYDAQWAQFATLQAKILRLKAELEGKTELDRKAMPATPVPNERAKSIIETEQAQLTARNSLHDKERDFLQTAIVTQDGRIKALSEQQEKEKLGVDQDTQELARVQLLFDKQTLPITRVVEARRTILLSSTRYLQTVAQRGMSERDRADLAAKLDKLPDQRRDTVLGDLRETETQLSETRAKLQALGDKLIYTGLVRSQLVRGKGGDPSIRIHRKSGDATRVVEATQDEQLKPGDVIDIALVLPDTSAPALPSDKKSAR